jgi:hypothetical protein
MKKARILWDRSSLVEQTLLPDFKWIGPVLLTPDGDIKCLFHLNSTRTVRNLKLFLFKFHHSNSVVSFGSLFLFLMKMYDLTFNWGCLNFFHKIIEGFFLFKLKYNSLIVFILITCGSSNLVFHFNFIVSSCHKKWITMR